LGYPSETEELAVLKATTGTAKPTLKTILSDSEITDLQQLTREVHIDDSLLTMVNQLVRASRPEGTSSAFVKQWCNWGAGPRAGQALILCSKARAVLNGRFAVIPEDIKTLAYPVLRHRIALNFRAEAENISTDKVIEELLRGFA
jgi:MoxR-like ATPase